MAWRKSWSFENINGPKGNSQGSKRKLSPISRSIWDDYLDLAELSPIKGKICIAEGIGYTQKQLENLLKIENYIDFAEQQMVRLGMIKINEQNRVISIKHWKHYQSEYDRLKKYKKGTENGTEQGTPKHNTTDTDTDVDTDKDIKTEAFNILLKDEAFIKQLENIYPNVAIEKEIKKMKGWVLGNPHRSKKNWKRFMVNWLNTAIDKYPSGAVKGEVIETPTRTNIEKWPEPPKEFTDLLKDIGNK